jgi:hypothetical protein
MYRASSAMLVVVLLLALAIVYQSVAPAGRPLLWEAELDPGLIAVRDGTKLLPAKAERWERKVRVAWVSTGAREYRIEAGSEASPEPAMVGAGDRLTYGRPGVRGKLAVGLWAHPAAIDIDDDGDMDLIVGCTDRPYSGTYLFTNLGGYFSKAEWIGRAAKDAVVADFNGDGKPRPRHHRRLLLRRQAQPHAGVDARDGAAGLLDRAG